MKDGRDINRTARRKKATITAVQWVLAIIVLIIIVFPIYWMLVSSVKSQEEILLPVPTLWPKEFHFENYINVLKKGNFARYYFNTAVMTAGILIGQGKTMQEAMDEVQMVVEGVYSAKAALALSKKYNVSMPLVQETNQVLFGGKTAAEALKDLMLRDRTIESENLLWENK